MSSSLHFSIIREHVDKNWGISNKLLDYMAKQLCPNFFKGVFNLRELDTISLSSKKPCSVICNLKQHFVLIHWTESFVYYIDSFGLECFQPDMCAFLLKLQRPVYVNHTQLQLKSSKHCGLYCLLFSIYLDNPVHMKKVSLVFSQTPGVGNDKRCIAYLQQLLT